MKAKITDENGFKCAPQGHTVEHFKFGEIVTGQVAAWALEARAAKRMFDKKAKGRAPENKGK